MSYFVFVDPKKPKWMITILYSGQLIEWWWHIGCGSFEHEKHEWIFLFDHSFGNTSDDDDDDDQGQVNVLSTVEQ